MTAEEFNINEAVAYFATENIGLLVDGGKGLFKAAADKARLKLTNTYSVYLGNVCKKHSYVKSFFFRAEPTFLYNFYVPTALRCSKGLIENPDVKTLVGISKRIVVVGSAGSGKSMLMRHLLLNSIEGKQRVPIFVELRQFSEGNFDLSKLVLAALRESKFQLDDGYVEKALKEGHFSLFLDGLDEVPHSKRIQVTRQIQEFARKYEKIALFVSSRQDNELEGWNDFLIMRMAPLSLELAEKLIEKIDYDPELKDKFSKELRASLFKRHQSLLSNPLLLTIMLLTYGQSANIPDKLNIFYNQAYEALFERHDALKSGYSGITIRNLIFRILQKFFQHFLWFHTTNESLYSLKPKRWILLSEPKELRLLSAIRIVT